MATIAPNDDDIETGHVQLQRVQIINTNLLLLLPSVISYRNGQILELNPDTALQHVIEMTDLQLQQTEINPMPLGNAHSNDNEEISQLHPDATDHTEGVPPRQQVQIDNNNNRVALEGNGHISETNPDHGNDRRHIESISTLFGVSHTAILSLVSFDERQSILFVSALVSTAIIAALVIIFFQEFSLRRGERSLLNSLLNNWCWVTKAIALVVLFIILSLCFFFSCNWMLKPRHH